MSQRSIEVLSQPTRSIEITPYLWLDVSIIGGVVLLFALVLAKWLPGHIDKRAERLWSERASIRQAESEKEALTRKAEAARLAQDRNLLNTLLATHLSSSKTVLDDLATTLVSIAKVLDLQEASFNAIAGGFKKTGANQAAQIEELKEIHSTLKDLADKITTIFSNEKLR